MTDEDLMPITAELLNAGQSDRGGWSKAQLALVGVAWPPLPGWKLGAIGRLIRRADAERFVALRGGRHTEGPGLFDLLE